MESLRDKDLSRGDTPGAHGTLSIFLLMSVFASVQRGWLHIL